MTYKHHTRLELVEGGNIFKQGDHPTLKFIAYDSLGSEVDLTNKQIEGALYSRNKGIMYEAPASFTDGRIVFTIDELLDNGKFQLEFTVTDSADPNYRAKFPSDEYAAELTIKPSKDNMEFVGVSMTTVAQLRAEQEEKQEQFELTIVPQVDELKQRVEEGIGAFTEDTEVKDARMGETNLRQFNEKTMAQLAETAKKEDILNTSKNLLENADFNALPPIQSRSSIYTFTAGVTSPQQDDKKSLQIVSAGYEGSSDANKDFAFLLGERISATDSLKVSFWSYPLTSGKQAQFRMAFTGSGKTVGLGEKDKWNKVEFTLGLSDMSQLNNFLYMNLNSSYTVYLSDLRIEYSGVDLSKTPKSFVQVSEKLDEQPTAIKNSAGVIERMIEIAQTYLDNVSKLSYGNFYTAYDASVQLVSGKNQIDCSSFAQLLIHGVPYEDSRYNGKTENKGSNFFFQAIDGYKYRYANQMAKYAFDKGYSFKAKPDFSNVEAGDVLFFNWTAPNSGSGDSSESETSFMGIDHVAVFLHKKNDGRWTTLQFDNGISSVYYDATNEYMSQCVLVARFPFSNLESAFPDQNILIDGEVVKSNTTGSTVGTYKLSQPLEKGKYYTLFLDVSSLVNNGYFIIQTTNFATVFSDFGKTTSYDKVVKLNFPYLLDEVTSELKVSVGLSSGSASDRPGNIKWASLFKGYKKNKREAQKNIGFVNYKTFALESALAADISSGLAPFYKYGIDQNKLLINFNIPFNTAKTGGITLGQLQSGDAPKNTQRLPVILVGANNEPVSGILQVSWNGTVSIVTYSGTTQWKYLTSNGIIFRE